MKRMYIYFSVAIIAMMLGFQSCEKSEPKAKEPVFSITAHPVQTLSLLFGSVSGSLTVEATIEGGDAAISYQWYENTSNSNSGGALISGATSNSYTLPSSLTAGSYYYFCEVRATGFTSLRSQVTTVTVSLPTPSSSLSVSISGNISHTVYQAGTLGSVTFNRFPVSFEEWKQAREIIGVEPHGAVALQVMASELYRRNRTAGTDCMRQAVVNSQYEPRIRRLNELYSATGNSARPYQMAAYLKGASWDNGYNPTKPYTIEMRVATGKTYENSTDFQATVIHLEIKSNGHETNNGWQPFAVLKTQKPGEPGENGRFFIVSEGSSIYLNCREISFTVPFNGLD